MLLCDSLLGALTAPAQGYILDLFWYLEKDFFIEEGMTHYLKKLTTSTFSLPVMTQLLQFFRACTGAACESHKVFQSSYFILGTLSTYLTYLGSYLSQF